MHSAGLHKKSFRISKLEKHQPFFYYTLLHIYIYESKEHIIGSLCSPSVHPFLCSHAIRFNHLTDLNQIWKKKFLGRWDGAVFIPSLSTPTRLIRLLILSFQRSDVRSLPPYSYFLTNKFFFESPLKSATSGVEARQTPGVLHNLLKYQPFDVIF